MRFIYTKTFTKIFTLFVILALFFILNTLGYIDFAKDGFLRAYGFATWKISAATGGVKSVFNTLFTIKNLVRENAALNHQVDELSFDNARLKSAQDENTALRKALNFQQQSDLNLLPAEVLTLDATGFSQIVIVNKGENHSVKINQPVVVA